MTKYQKRLIKEAKERKELNDYQAVNRFNGNRMTLNETRKMAGHKIQRSSNEKLDRLQRNTTNVQSGRARGEYTYYSGGLWDRSQMYVG